MLSQCAESKVFHCDFYGHKAVQKIRFKKEYRLAVLDSKIREQRTCREARALVRCRKLGVLAPTVYAVDRATCSITMEHIDGMTARDFIVGCQDKRLAVSLLSKIGAVVGRLHEGDIIHGDLTTSNFMLQPEEGLEKLVVFDFGLVRDSASAEERAVDLYVLERAVQSSHPHLIDDVEAAVWSGYASTISKAKADSTQQRLQAVRARGRKRSMVG